ncbi:HAMP domain-containing sensor histidine kinase [Nocardioides sp.]|uniref:sensor histidine kinase n=1 Tax=Nocardioides sp. TaxID=35761 RepID=UPI00260802A0|nr:HAMP domain-containing sensor histidine kinase [Nocardioides sp.]
MTVASVLEERWHYRRSLASRVTILTTVAVAFVVAALSIVVYVVLRVQLSNNLDDSLRQRADSAAASPALQELTGQLLIPTAALGAADIRIAFLYNNNNIYVPDRSGSFPDLGAQELAVSKGQADSSIRTVGTGDDEYRVVAVRTVQPGQALVLAQSLSPQNRMLHRLGIVMFLVCLIGVGVACVLGWLVAANGLRPVRRLTGSVEEIARTEDLTPIPVEGDDEIARLATAFNGLLVSLAASRDRQRQLIADAGHELRTPLTSMRTNIDLLTQADLAANAGGGGITLAPAQREELLTDVRAQMEELTTLIGDLVALAREEEKPVEVGPVALHEVLDHAVSRVRLRAPSLVFDVRAEPWWVVGDASGLERALTNLLDNAAKFSPTAGTVHVRLVDGTVTVDDEGPGIADADLPHVFERFYRSAESRAMPGSGLGLSIVKQTADRHGGQVSASRNHEGGARVTFTVPGATSPVPEGAPA